MKKIKTCALLFILTWSCLALYSCANIAPARLPDFTEESADENKMPMLKSIDDPLERYNRTMTSFNEGFFRWVIYPFNRGYNFVIPAPARKRINNVGYNMKYLVRGLNTLLQGKWRGTLDETNRFLINTTIGVFGVFDPATKLGIEHHREDFGQTLGYYTGRRGVYFVLPFLGPSSGRDTIGKLFDYPLDLASWLVGARAFFGNNDLSFNNDTYALLLQNTGDTYTLARNFWAIDRQKDVEDYKITFTESDPEPSLQSVFFTPHDPDFFKRGTTRMVTPPATGKQLPFTYWLQEQKAPLVLVLPGLGAHRLSAKTLAMAEMVYNHGYSAITISDTLNWEFIERASSVPVPGYTPQDCEDLITTFKLIRDDMVKLYPDRASSTALVGMSMGALKTLFIAAMEAQTDDPLFDRYLAINPPVNMFYGVTQLDNFFNAPLKLDPSERDAKIKEILFKTITLGQGELTPGEEVPLSRLESDFLIGLNFRYTLRDIIYTSQCNNSLGVLKCNLGSSKRQPCYNEIQGYSYRDYAEKFVFPYYLDKGNFAKTKEELLNRASLKSIEDQLRENENIRVHINENDFLLRPQDIVWLGSVFGNRLVRFKEGGHLGNLHLPRVQAKIMESLTKQNITETLADSTIYPKSVKDTRENTGKVKTIAPPATLATDEEVVGGEKERNTPLLPEDARSSAKEVIQKLILEWKHEWESKDHENYMRRYSREFTSRDMDWNQWSAYKKDLSERYYQISLTFKDTHITLANTNTQAVVSFKQYYRSDDYSDYGIKSLRLKKENGEWKIFNEQWKPL